MSFRLNWLCAIKLGAKRKASEAMQEGDPKYKENYERKSAQSVYIER